MITVRRVGCNKKWESECSRSKRWTLEAKGGHWKQKSGYWKQERWTLEAKKVDIKTKKLKFTVHGNWELGSHKQVEIPEK